MLYYYHLAKDNLFMNEHGEKLLEAIACDDAKWDECFPDLAALGLVSNSTFSAYSPPRDAEGKAVYDRHWEKAGKRDGNSPG